METDSVDALVRRYQSAAARHGAAATPRAANEAADEIAAVYRELRRRGAQAMECLLPLLAHGDPSVRGWAASHALMFLPERGEPVLEELAAGPPGAIRADASMTLGEWRAGRLRFP